MYTQIICERNDFVVCKTLRSQPRFSSMAVVNTVTSFLCMEFDLEILTVESGIYNCSAIPYPWGRCDRRGDDSTASGMLYNFL